LNQDLGWPTLKPHLRWDSNAGSAVVEGVALTALLSRLDWTVLLE
jgi:hypothetical protein